MNVQVPGRRHGGNLGVLTATPRSVGRWLLGVYLLVAVMALGFSNRAAAVFSPMCYFPANSSTSCLTSGPLSGSSGYSNLRLIRASQARDFGPYDLQFQLWYATGSTVTKLPSSLGLYSNYVNTVWGPFDQNCPSNPGGQCKILIYNITGATINESASTSQTPK